MTYDPTAVAMALLTASDLKSASNAEVSAACNVLATVHTEEAGEAFARCVSETGRRLMACDTLAQVEDLIGRVF